MSGRQVDGLIDEVAEQVAQLERKPLRVLDAGAGRALRLKLPPDVHITGIDINPDVLSAHTALDERIVGDLQTYPLETRAYDFIACWDVLEHVEDPGSALRNMIAALAPGGLLAVGGPNLWSPKALITKFTPHSFHVWVHRTLLGSPNAGKPGFVPFPTYLRVAGAPRRMAKTSQQQGLDVTMLAFYTGGQATYLPKPLRVLWLGLMDLLRRIPSDAHFGDSDFCLVVRRPEPELAPSR